jgi:GT2 family glycosyltransferase
VIGRNEGEHLVRCLAALAGSPHPIVYVDSGSTDGSPERARAAGVDVVELDGALPFTAGRGRNAGLRHLRERHPGIPCVQFFDGDCEPQPGWLEAGLAELRDHPEVAMVCGRLRERHPERSPYNRLAALEWELPTGEIQDCGGNALVRAALFEAIGGFDVSLVAGEEPELCLRLRRAGHRIVRLPVEMATHDAALLTFRQWWRRQARSGHSYAELLYLQGAHPEPFWVRSLLSIAFWGGALPLAALAAAPATSGWSLGLLLAYGALWKRMRDARADRPGAALYATACVVGKFAELAGALLFFWNRLVRRRASGLFE